MSSIWKYHALLPAIPADHRISLGEGQTPLVRSRQIAAALGLKHLYFKLDNLNPTGSYKDRFAASFVSLLRSRGQNLCICTSSGNTGAALAAYCAAAGIQCFVATVEGAPVPKIKQMQLYGAKIAVIRGFGKEPGVTSDVFKTLENFVRERSLPLPISAYHYCPEGMMGVQTIAYEILDEMPEGLHHIFSPAGGGGLTLAVAKGVLAYKEKSVTVPLPKVHCVQPNGNNTIAGPLRDNLDKARPIPFSNTSVSGLQVPSVIDGDEVIKHCGLLQGNGYQVPDEEVFGWHKRLACEEGIFCEPAGAVALAGLSSAVGNKEIDPNDKIVCLVTGSGFKDMAAVDTHFNMPGINTLETVGLLQKELTLL